MSYDHRTIESTQQQRWMDEGIYRSVVDWDKPKHYALTMLPYPSGDLHIGHWYAMTPSDARARYMRMKGFNVLFPMGFDAFGLPAENAAVQRNIHPAVWTWANIDRMRGQLRSMGAMFDWEREAISCEPSYYKWTEWFFAQMFEHDIAYRGEAVVNWSPTLQTVLANEQVIDGRDERTGQPVIQKLMEQWFFAITSYADELLDHSSIDWPESIRAMQANWIGRSEGARVDFAVADATGQPTDRHLTVFTTRPDTLWGATFMVLAPEHPLVDVLTSDEQRVAVVSYREEAARRTELERLENENDKTGVFTGGFAINPVNGAEIPVWIADYVLISYGTGAIMAVPAHDERDFAFARRFGLEVTPVIDPADGDLLSGTDMPEAYVGPGTMVNSGPLDGLPVNDAKGRANPSIAAAIDWLVDHQVGEESVNYRLRDWLISRQRYWGSPIPIIHREDGTLEVVPTGHLPVVLPEDVEFEGRSPLVSHPDFVSVVDSTGGQARRETDTMDTFMCSSWYWFRYLSPHYEAAAFDPEEAAYWLPVDVYTGGAEHAVMHLLYARFFVKAMRDMGHFDDTIAAMARHGRSADGLFDEPFTMLRNQGQILGEERKGDRLVISGTRDGNRVLADSVGVDAEATADAGLIVGELMRRTENLLQVDVGDQTVTVEVPEGVTVEIPSIDGVNDVNQLKHHLDVERMSKSRGNVVNPDLLVEQYGADTVRTYLMFAFEWQKGGPWDSRGIVGSRRFIEDVWRLGTFDYRASLVDDNASLQLRRQAHRTIQKVGRELEAFKWNTAVAALMSLRNDLLDARKKADVSVEVWNEAIDSMLLLLAPIAPHITDELWRRRGHDGSVHLGAWPEFDPALIVDDTVTMVVQINGKVRDRVEVAVDISAEDAQAVAVSLERIQEWLDGKSIKTVVARPPKLVNLVVIER